MCLKVQANSFSEPPLQYNQNQVSLTDEGCLWPLFNNMGVTGSFKTPFGTVTIGLSELHLRYRRFIFKKWKKWFLWAMATTQAVENHGERLELIFSIKDIYIYLFQSGPTHKISSSSRNTKFKDISCMIMKIVPINMRIVLTRVIKIDISFWVWWKVNWNWLEFSIDRKPLWNKC